MELPVFDMSPFLTTGPASTEVKALCHQVGPPVFVCFSFHQGKRKDLLLISSCLCEMAECMHHSGILIVKDPRVSMQDNETFLSMLERYFEQPPEVKKQGPPIPLPERLERD